MDMDVVHWWMDVTTDNNNNNNDIYCSNQNAFQLTMS